MVEAQVGLAILVYLRMLGATVMMPALGERTLSVRTRAVVALALTGVLYPAVATRELQPELSAVPGLALGELFFGLIFGMILRLIVMALQICGSIIAQVTSLAQLMGFTSVEPLPVVGHILAFAGLALLVMADMHVYVVQTLIGSYDVFPVGALPAPGALAELFVARTAELFGFAFALSAPFVLMATVYNLGLGAINRAMPQLMVALVGAPAILLATLTLLAITAPILLSLWLDVALETLIDPFGATR